MSDIVSLYIKSPIYIVVLSLEEVSEQLITSQDQLDSLVSVASKIMEVYTCSLLLNLCLTSRKCLYTNKSQLIRHGEQHLKESSPF